MSLSAPPPPNLDRTPSAHARYVTAGVRCFERTFPEQESRPPVKLVVFDCDETLTLSTFMPKDKALRTQIGWIEWAEFIANVNFESPFVDGSRIERLKECLENIKNDGEEERVLTVLTRNESGAIACLNLLMMAKLHNYFSAIWSMHTNSPAGKLNACYKNGSEWVAFESPVRRCFDHKADCLVDVCEHPFDWFPQLLPAGRSKAGDDMRVCLNLRLENIVLVDDVRTNFQSHSPTAPKLYRYCKIARYDSEYREMGLVTNMGGLGARNKEDYMQLENFVREPWRFKEAQSIRCSERPFACADGKPPVALVVFDFDETLSLYTFMPEGRKYRTEIGYAGSSEEERARFVRYNFESPYVEGDRITKLQNMLKRLEDSAGDNPRTLAVLTKNEDGAVAVLNLLLMANLADHFSVIWTLGADSGVPNGVYKDTDGWKVYSLPLGSIDQQKQKYKPIVINDVISRPEEWFPQLPKSSDAKWQRLKELAMEHVVLVDDERGSFQLKDKKDADEDADDLKVFRYCKVAHYDDEYRDQGLLVHMGGIGAKTDKDYEKLALFVDAPWKSRVVDDLEDLHLTGLAVMRFGSMLSEADMSPGPELERGTQDGLEKSSKGERKIRKSITSAAIFGETSPVSPGVSDESRTQSAPN